MPVPGPAITITGQNFRSGATATVGGQVCANPIVLSPTSLACSVPAKTATCTAQNVVVTHPDDLQSGTGMGLFTYRTATLGFAAPAPANYPTGTGPRRIVSADFNGDGNADIAFGGEDKLIVMSGDGEAVSRAGSGPARNPQHELVPPGRAALRGVRIQRLCKPPDRDHPLAYRHGLQHEPRAPVAHNADCV